uniref:CUB and Sushi multiple domains 1 n=1 Tax=Meleagris gallopavo TaxID=9103 RepID=G3UUU4_MELGA
ISLKTEVLFWNSTMLHWLVRLVYVGSISCFFNFTTPSGIILSPNYPEEYGNNMNCVWLIISEPGSRIHLIFNDFDVEPQFDYLTVKDDGISDLPPLGTFSGVTLESDSCLDPGIPVNGHRHGNNFNIRSTVTFSCDPGYTLSDEEPLICERNHQWNHALPSCDARTCGSNLRGPSGIITSPNYPVQYEDNAHCVTAQPGDRDSGTDGQTEEVFFYFSRLTGMNLPSPVISSKNWLRLHFTSDSNHRRKGFNAQFQGRKYKICSRKMALPLNISKTVVVEIYL